MRTGRVRVFRVVRAPGVPNAAAWARALAGEPWLDCSTVLKSEGASWVRRATLLGRDVVIKGQALLSVPDRVKGALGHTRADRQWRGAAWLSMKSIACAPVLARARADIGGADTDLLIMGFVEGATLLHVMADSRNGRLPVRTEHDLARAVGSQVMAMLGASGYNRDHKPSNLLVPPGGGGPIVLDSVAIRHGPFARVASGGERMLASLVIEPTGCGVRPRRALLLRTLHAAMGGEPEQRSDAKALWRRIELRVSAHGDPRPRINPLSGRESREQGETQPRNK